MNYRIWYSAEAFANFIIDNTKLIKKNFVKKRMYESDANNANNFHSMPDHIKKILYLDAPDIIVEIDHEPIFSVEISTEAGTGHNAFQRFARLAASVENNVPAIYIYPEAVIVSRQGCQDRWDKINPLIFKALDDVMSIHGIPALMYYYPSNYRNYMDATTIPNKSNKGLLPNSNRNYSGSPTSNDPEMSSMFNTMNEIIDIFEKHGIIKGREKLLANRLVIARRTLMIQEFIKKGGHLKMSPLSATINIPTQYLLNYLSKYENSKYSIGELLRSRTMTVIYKANATFRSDPYPGALVAIDYLLCREGKSFEERKYNLVLAWSDIYVDHANQTIKPLGTKGKIKDFTNAVQASEDSNILSKEYKDIPNHQIPRYYMQVRYGSTYSKAKHIRVISYFADAMLFPDGALWRDG